MRTLAALTIVACSLMSVGCAETSVKAGLQTRSAIYANSLLEQIGRAHV